MASLRARAIRWITSRFVKGMDAETIDVQELRGKLNRIARLLRTARRVGVEKTEICGLYAEWLRPKEAAAGKEGLRVDSEDPEVRGVGRTGAGAPRPVLRVSALV